jgi:FkbM family methyltransferase
MGQSREFDIRIGQRRFRITTDDTYLRKHRPKWTSAIDAAWRRLSGRDGFEPSMVRLFESLVPQRGSVFDIGANVGCTAILFGQIAKEVVAFEPLPRTFAFLQANVHRSGLRNVRTVNCGLGQEVARERLLFSPENRSGAVVVSDSGLHSVGTVQEIEVRRLDDEVRRLGVDRIDFIKLDVEGFERSVLEGACDTLARYRPVVQLELNHWCLNTFHRTSVPDHIDFLLKTFPLLHAVEGREWIDLRCPVGRYRVFQEHILSMRFHELVAAFDQAQLERFYSAYRPHPVMMRRAA